MATNKVSKETKAKRGATGPSVRRGGTTKMTAKRVAKNIGGAITGMGKDIGRAAAKKVNQKRYGKQGK